MSGQVMLFSSAAFLFMLLLMCCDSGGVVCAEEVNSVSQPSSVELFKKGETKVDASGTDVSSFSAHSLVDVNGLMVAFAEANSNCESDDGSCCSIEIWSKSLKYEKDKLPSEIIKKEDGDQRMAQAVVSKMRNESYCTQLFGPSAAVKDDKIYILLSNFTTPKTSKKGGSNALLWDLELVVGTVATPADSSPKTITWGPSKSLKDILKQKLTDDCGAWDELRVFGRGIVMGGSTILFPIHATTSSVEGSNGCTVIYSEDNGDNWNFPSEKIIDKDCRYVTLLEWEGKLLMIPIPSSSSRTRKVHVSADNGKTWAEDGETGSSLLVDFLIRATSVVENGMMTATINGKNLTLISQPAISSGNGALDQVHLFVTDNKRITSVGPISLDHDISSDCKLLLAKENGGLFALCDKGSQDSPESVVLFSLTEQLERISSVLQGWESTDERVSKICISATEEAPCSTPMPTTGLIGFLSNNGNDTHWADEYLGVNATVTDGTKVENGFKLSGSCAKVEWRFGEQEQNQLYSFADLGLTLVATVTIHDIPKSDTPLMSVGFASKTVGLWYGKENHWKGIIGGEEEGTGTWEKDKPYQVAITVLNGTGSVYIGGKCLGGLDPNVRPNKDGKASGPSEPSGAGDVPHELKEEVRYICFGKCPFMHNGYESNAASSFTVTNVFLYNRVLSEAELLPPPPPPPPPLQQSQTTAKETGEATITGNSTDEERADKPAQQEQEQSQSTAKKTGETTITGNPTDEERADKPAQQEQEQSQSTAKKTGETTITGNPTDEERSDTTRAGNDNSVHESLSSPFQLFALLVFLGSANL